MKLLVHLSRSLIFLSAISNMLLNTSSVFPSQLLQLFTSISLILVLKKKKAFCVSTYLLKIRYIAIIMHLTSFSNSNIHISSGRFWINLFFFRSHLLLCMPGNLWISDIVNYTFLKIFLNYYSCVLVWTQLSHWDILINLVWLFKMCQVEPEKFSVQGLLLYTIKEYPSEYFMQCPH